MPCLFPCAYASHVGTKMLLNICTLLYRLQKNVNVNEAQSGKRSGVTWVMFTAILRKLDMHQTMYKSLKLFI